MSDTEDAAAPIFDVPDREVVALEHPMIIQNLENAIKTFGTNRPFLRVSIFISNSVPLHEILLSRGS
jgi:general transcription factor 3C polypeptide 5 (transcription factor C subunit 1)